MSASGRTTCGSWRRPAPGRACLRRTGLVDVSRDRGRADEADRLDVRVIEQRGRPPSLSPWTTLNTPSGSRPLQQLGQEQRADGSFSDGLRMNVLPQAMALGNIHIGTMAGKLNGVMPATRPAAAGSGRRRRRLSLLGEAALEQLRDAAGELDVLESARHFAHRVGQHLAVLGGSGARRSRAGSVDELADAEHDLGAPRQRGRAPGRQGSLAPPRRPRRPLGGGEVDLASACRWPGCRRGRSAPRSRRQVRHRSSG